MKDNDQLELIESILENFGFEQTNQLDKQDLIDLMKEYGIMMYNSALCTFSQKLLKYPAIPYDVIDKAGEPLKLKYE